MACVGAEIRARAHLMGHFDPCSPPFSAVRVDHRVPPPFCSLAGLRFPPACLVNVRDAPVLLRRVQLRREFRVHVGCDAGPLRARVRGVPLRFAHLNLRFPSVGLVWLGVPQLRCDSDPIESRHPSPPLSLAIPLQCGRCISTMSGLLWPPAPMTAWYVFGTFDPVRPKTDDSAASSSSQKAMLARVRVARSLGACRPSGPAAWDQPLSSLS